MRILKKSYSFLFTFLVINSAMAGQKGIIEKNYIAQFLPPNPIIIEAGAHNGGDTYQMATMWPSATIYAFEPIPELYNTLIKRTHRFNNVYCYPYALSNTNGQAIFHVSSGTSDASSSLLEPKEHLVDHPEVKFTKKITVPTITLNTWTKENNIDHVDFLWLDLQGAELLVLKDAHAILSTVSVIYTEVQLHEAYKGCSLYNEYREWLEQHGFCIVREELPWQDAGNVLFVKKALLTPAN